MQAGCKESLVYNLVVACMYFSEPESHFNMPKKFDEQD